MRQELDVLVKEYESELRKCGEAQSLEQLQEAYTNVSSMQDELYDYINDMYSQSDDPEGNSQLEMMKMMEWEATIAEKYPFPAFDDSMDEYELFDEYPTYFQRYGCMDVDNIISWDDNSILFHDIESNCIEIIRRPDVLMRGDG